MKEWLDKLILHSIHFDFPIHRAIQDLSPAEYKLLWNGNKYFKGLHAFFKHLEDQSYKIQYRVLLSRYRGRTNCYDCSGSRLRPDSDYVKVSGKSLGELLMLPVNELLDFFTSITLSPQQAQIAERAIIEVMLS